MKRALNILLVVYLVAALAAGAYIYISRNYDGHAGSQTAARITDDTVSEDNTDQDAAAADTAAEETEATDSADENAAADESDDSAAGEEETKHYYAFVVKSSALNFRSGPGANYEKLYTLKKGETGMILEPGELFSKVVTQEGVGYVSNDYITLFEVSESKIPEEYQQYFDTAAQDSEDTDTQ